MAQFEFNQQVDKRAILLLFGCYCNNPYYVESNYSSFIFGLET